MNRKKLFINASVMLILFLIFLSQIVNIIIDLKWFNEIGYLSVYLTKMTAILKLMLPIFILCFISIKIYIKSIKKSIMKWKKVINVNLINEKREKRINLILNTVISFIVSFMFALMYWYKVIQFTNSTSFNIKDPIFNIDISFFIFRLPLIESLYSVILSLIILFAVITFITYIILITKDSVMNGRKSVENIKEVINFKSGITNFAGKQLAVLAAILLICIGIGHVLKALNLVYSPRGLAFGASYTDTKITLRFYQAIVIASIVSSIVVFISILKSKTKPIVISIILIFLLIVSEGIVAGAWQKFIVKSNERRLETPFIQYNMDYTKKAFKIDNIQEQMYPISNKLTKEIIDRNKATINNINVNSVVPALEFYNQVESKKNYYGFNDIDIDRYNINGKYTQVFIAPREIMYDKLQDKASTWQNKHLTYTHGYGVVVSKVNSVTPEGKPDFIIKDMPLLNKSDIRIDEPRIYFGEKTNEYALVNTKINEMDYPKENGENATKNYDGKVGMKMNFFNRLLFAINQSDIKFLLSGDITSESRILIRRNIMERAQIVAPFLSYDKDPYIVINNGKLYWILDGYTSSNRYPFSEPINKNVNYIRNSVKVIINALDGTMDFYLVDKNDPIAVSYSKVFPKLFKDIDKLPEGFREHLRYPEDMFLIQCKVLEKYHVDDVNSFFSGQNVWDISKSKKTVEGEVLINEASYVTMKLPGEEKEEILLLEYFNQNQRENMVAIFGARMDKDNYGKIVLYKFPTTESETINSPILFKQKINQDTTISKEISLWDAKGSEVQFGDTMIIPIENSLLYVEPLYLRAQGEKSIPEMKRVIVSYADKIILAENIDEALRKLFNYEENNAISEESNGINIKTPNEIKEARDIYNRALEAQKSGDWAKYGEYIKELGEVLNKLSE